MVVLIVSPYVTSALELEEDVVVRAPTHLSFMVGWNLVKVQTHCITKGWLVKVL
jgi:hypothetical protein